MRVKLNMRPWLCKYADINEFTETLFLGLNLHFFKYAEVINIDKLYVISNKETCQAANHL